MTLRSLNRCAKVYVQKCVHIQDTLKQQTLQPLKKEAVNPVWTESNLQDTRLSEKKQGVEKCVWLEIIFGKKPNQTQKPMCLCIHMHHFVYTDIRAHTATVYKGTGHAHDMISLRRRERAVGKDGLPHFSLKSFRSV